MCCGCDTFYIVSVHIQCQTSMYTLSLCRGHSWRVRLAKKEMLTPPVHLVSPLVFRVRKCPPWCSISGATVTVHQFFCFLHICHTCSLCRVELVVLFPARGSTQVLLCLFPRVLWLWHFLYSVGPHPVSNLHVYTFVVSRAFMAGAASQEGDADSSRAPGLTFGFQGPWMSTVVLYCWCHSDSASFRLYFRYLSHLFPLPCWAGTM